jgi:hypothetical protein
VTAFLDEKETSPWVHRDKFGACLDFELPAFVNKPTPVSFSLKQRIAFYFNPRCLFSLRQHARASVSFGESA